MCLISVIMGVYNIEKLWAFEKSMQSVLGQTVRDFEFLICDDGSTDHTYQILCRYARQDGRIRVLRSQSRRGLGAALNRCMRHSKGTYLARQDADDISLPDRFQRQTEFLKKHPGISFAGTNVILYDSAGDWGRRLLPAYPRKEDFLFTSPFVHGSLMFCRKAFQTAGGYRVGKQTLRAEDYDLLMHMYAAGLRGANLRTACYKFLEDKDTWKRRKYGDRLDEMKVRLQGFRELGLLPQGLPYVMKPLVVGLIPARLLLRLKNGHTIQMPGTH